MISSDIQYSRQIDFFPLCGNGWIYRILRYRYGCFGQDSSSGAANDTHWHQLGWLPRNQQKGCKETSTGFIPLTNGSFCHTPFSLVWNPSEAVVATLLSKVLLWGTRKNNFCLRFSWECLQYLPTVLPYVPWSKAGEMADAGTTEPSSHPESHLQWLPLCSWIREAEWWDHL